MQGAGMDNSSQWHVPFNATKYFLVPIYSLVLVAGLPLNGLALWALLSQTSTSVLFTYMLNVVAANLLQLLTLPFWIHYSRQDHAWPWGSAACRGVGLAFLTALYAKNGFLCLIAVERYLGLAHPLRFRRLQTARSAAGVSAASWALVVTLCLVGGILQPVERVRPHLCYEQLCPREKGYALFRMAAMVLSFFLPCFFMTFFYLRGLGTLKEVTTLDGKAKRKITRFIACMIAAFYLLQVPYQATSYSKFMAQLLLENSCPFEARLFLYDRLALCLTTLGAVADPFLYILLLKDVRAALAKRLPCWGSAPAAGGGAPRPHASVHHGVMPPPLPAVSTSGRASGREKAPGSGLAPRDQVL
ncbi:G-protein coupled receptor 4-like [Dromaius novaehollandiae]|uniref:G-protein coupled receptor 4-like n=1 Tax=Dromaius novaehollandiae TaxID=8790 RepID=UPI00311F8BBD